MKSSLIFGCSEPWFLQSVPLLSHFIIARGKKPGGILNILPGNLSQPIEIIRCLPIFHFAVGCSVAKLSITFYNKDLRYFRIPVTFS